MNRAIATLLAASLLAACHPAPPASGTVVQVLSCTDSSSWTVAPQCRVVLADGRRTTVRAPAAVGDQVVAYWDGSRYRFKPRGIQ